jgi:hypothetical protein
MIHKETGSLNMPIQILGSSDGLVTLGVTGEMKRSDLAQIQGLAVNAIGQWGKIRVLVILENFRGWEHGADWEDTRFVETHGRDIERMAIVGDEEWRDLACAFAGKGFRPTAIEYFSPSERDKAQAWVAVA